jgi:tetratricopeptide (TPR) repeat protein
VDQISPLQYFLTQCTVIPRYLGLVILPWGFNVDHDVPLATGLSVPVAAGLAFLAALLAFGLYALRRWPLVGFGIVWFFVALSVESSFLPIQDFMVEHRMYLAMPGVAIAVAVPFAWALARWRTTTLAAGTLLAAGLCTLTFMRNEVWRTPIALWQDALAKSPRKARAHANLGAALALDGQVDAAILESCKALEIDPNYKPAEANLQAMLEEQIDQESDEAEMVLEVVEMGPDGTVTIAPPNPCQKILHPK